MSNAPGDETTLGGREMPGCSCEFFSELCPVHHWMSEWNAVHGIFSFLRWAADLPYLPGAGKAP